jgi:hypothetical protein
MVGLQIDSRRPSKQIFAEGNGLYKGQYGLSESKEA